jgi:cytosine/creatinine deaminase
MNQFRTIEFPDTSQYVLRNARVPSCLMAAPSLQARADPDDALLVDIDIADGKIRAITPASSDSPAPGAGPAVDLRGCHVWPTLVDVHTHLDKGHIIGRTQNLAGDFAGARDATRADRERYWSAGDVRGRMEFGLRCAEAHGVSAIRTHLDSYEGQGDTTWAVFREVREAWRGRIELQAAALMPIDFYSGPYGDHLADVVAQSGGIIGGVTRPNGGLHGEHLEDIDALLDRLFTLAAARDLDLDLHIDETGDPQAATLWNVAEATLRHGYEGRVTCGHCCSLAMQDEAQAARTIALVAQARISVVTLPTVNLYLQDRVNGRTPRWRGVTMVKELRQAGVRVAAAGDNCRDPFYAYGDHDMVDTFRQAVRILHLDHPHGDAPALVAKVPGEMMGIDHGVLRNGGPARMVVFNARSMNELVARPQSDRIVIREGRRQRTELPDYEELAFVAAAKAHPPGAPLTSAVAAE